MKYNLIKLSINLSIFSVKYKTLVCLNIKGIIR